MIIKGELSRVQVMNISGRPTSLTARYYFEFYLSSVYKLWPEKVNKHLNKSYRPSILIYLITENIICIMLQSHTFPV
jgi:hypothetical protein